MTKSLTSAGLAALSFAVSTGVLAIALAPATASASTVSPDLQVTAQRDPDVITRRVSTADLDLTNKADLRRLDRRLIAATFAVCDDGSGKRIRLQDSSCFVAAKQSADLQVARLREKAEAFAAAGLPARVATTVVIAGQ